MAIGDQLEKLAALHKSGELSDEQYEKAKEEALRGGSAEPDSHADGSTLGGLFGGDGRSLGGAANRYVNYQIVMGAIGLVIFVVFAIIMLSSFGRASFLP